MDNKKIILCYPSINRYRSERPYHWFPFSVLPIAQALSNCGYHPVVLDYRVEKNAYQKLIKHLKDAIWVGISSMSGYQIAGGLRIAKNVRKINPNIPIIWGGWHPTILPEETVNNPFVDIVVAGNGEKTIVEIADAIKRKRSIKNIKGIAYKSGRNVVFTGYKNPTDIQDDAQQYSKYINIQSYINPKTMALGYFSGYGCVFKCAFCSRHFMTKKYLPYPVKKVMEDISYFVNRYSFKKIHFQDDNFFINPARVLQIAQNLIKSGHSLEWWANARTDVIYKLTKKETGILVRSGLATLFIGVESASQRMLDTMNKGTKTEDIMRTNGAIKNFNVALHLSYIFGVPGETIEDLKLTIRQIKALKNENKNVQVQTCFYQPYPGTELYQKALELGYEKTTGLEKWSLLKPQEKFNKMPWMSEKELRLYRKEFNSFFGG
ncbi:MAG: radical SAM protein [bacterium]|nr:radical SAM protein [bacterium]